MAKKASKLEEKSKTNTAKVALPKKSKTNKEVFLGHTTRSFRG